MIFVLAAFLALALFVLGLPGRIAIARKHPDADAINIMGWMGFLAIVPWMQAFMWAFKPTDVVDIRYFPKQERRTLTKNWRNSPGGLLLKKLNSHESTFRSDQAFAGTKPHAAKAARRGLNL